MSVDRSALRDEVFRAVEAIGERHFTQDALERQIKDWAVKFLDLLDEIDRLRPVADAAVAWRTNEDADLDGPLWSDFLNAVDALTTPGSEGEG